ncbi:CYTH domain-containing protein [Ferdinandcohnia quinoae]|uniref:CYTH domain-containing protein n=1 Tax=Fredinandcohnia quinoae TaxID=2918902 RepID=A0AAW5E3V3_9BACI|nr:CYTH domain-containing protein [Fredinandcohnia sp. SECRCQ15]MCH1626234.1 CYTH domain-containing protein [Fredinandcohnia sp. SECRCQ15]
MTQELEIEFKNMITEVEYKQLLSIFSVLDEQFVLQENFYFDTPHFSLKQQGMALRIREKHGTYTLTLKQPVERGLLETHQLLTVEQANTLLSGGKLIPGQIADIIGKFSIQTDEIEYFGSLKTRRAEFEYKNGLLVLDESSYLNFTDYEVEYEVTDEKIGQVYFHELLQAYKIPIRKTENKIRRFYNRKRQITLGEMKDEYRL